MDLVTGVDEYIRSGLLPYYYGIVIIFALYVLHKFKYDLEALFIVLIFNEGLFIYLGTNFESVANIHKIGFTVFAIWLYLKPILMSKKNKSDIFLLTCFFLIGVAYLLSHLINESNFITSLSQYLKKYFLPLLFFFGVRKNITNEYKMEWYAHLFTWLLGIQILLQLVKLALFGFGESLVGSISFSGGGASNVIPVLGFLIIWVKYNGALKYKDWLFIILLFLSFAIIGNKRSIWFTMTFMMLYIHYFFGHKFKLTKLIMVTPLIIILFIIGAKTNPTLNPEYSRWGSFDVQYIMDYAVDYTFGTEKTGSNLGYGRGGGTLYFMDVAKSRFDIKQMLFGEGLDRITADYADFDNEKYGLGSKGSASSFVQNFIALGLVGTLSIFIFGLLLAHSINDRIFFLGIASFLIFEYFLLYNSIININACAILFIFICNYFNYKRFYYHSV